MLKNNIWLSALLTLRGMPGSGLIGRAGLSLHG